MENDGDGIAEPLFRGDGLDLDSVAVRFPEFVPELSERSAGNPTFQDKRAGCQERVFHGFDRRQVISDARLNAHEVPSPLLGDVGPAPFDRIELAR